MRPHVIAMALVALALPACGGPAGDGPAGTPDHDRPAGGWELVEATGVEGPIDLLDSHPVTLVIEDDLATLGGVAACNHYGGTVEVDRDDVTITDLYQTEMACEPPAAMEVERTYLTALAAADTLSQDGDRLTLTGPDVELRFVRLPEEVDEELTGTVWELDTLLRGDAASSVPAADTPPTLRLGADGQLVATTGCNEVTAAYATDAGRLEVTAMVTTDVACPEELAPLEEHVVAVLGDRNLHAEIEGSRLTLTTADGLGLSYRAR